MWQGEKPVFAAPRTIGAGEPLLLTNLMPRQVNETVFYPLAEGATDDDVQEFFAAMEAGEWVNPPFDVTTRLGAPPLSPGRSQILDAPLVPGRYALVTWVFDMSDGVSLASKGMHSLVTVR